MTEREAMKLALEALENWMRIDTVEDMHIFETVTAPEAIAVLRKALEQPECTECNGMGFRDGVGDKCKKCGGEGAEPWDTTDMAHRAGGLSMEQEPVAWVRDLTSAQPNCVTDLRYMSVADTGAGVQYIPLYTSTIGEPVKERISEPDGNLVGFYLERVYEIIIDWDERGGKRSRRELARRIVNFYTAPTKREWVGLTEEEREYLWGITPIEDEGRFAFVLAVEAKPKEKNGIICDNSSQTSVTGNISNKLKEKNCGL